MFVKAEQEESKKRPRLEVSSENVVLRWAKALVLPTVFAALVVCMLYGVISNQQVAEGTKATVVVATQRIAAKSYILAEEIAEYFEEVKIDADAVSSTAYASLEELEALATDGFYVENDLAQNQIIYTEDVAVTEASLGKYKEGYQLTSFSVSNFAYGVNGALRKGDVVDIYAQDLATGELALMVEQVYIYEAYDSSGNKLEANDADSVATAFTVYITSDEVASLNYAIICGGLQMYQCVE